LLPAGQGPDRKNRDKLLKIAEALLEKEILSSDEINELIDGQPKTRKATGPEITQDELVLNKTPE